MVLVERRETGWDEGEGKEGYQLEGVLVPHHHSELVSTMNWNY